MIPRHALLGRIVMTCILFAGTMTTAAAGEDRILDTAGNFYRAGDYYSTITEIMRYQSRYPSGIRYPFSMLLMGKAYTHGRNVKAAVNAFMTCYRDFSGRTEAEEALYLAGFVRLMYGTPADAMMADDLYRSSYRDGAFSEEVARDSCFAAALSLDGRGALDLIKQYRERYPRGKYLKDADRLEFLVREDTARPRRLMWLSVLGSVFMPGFGQFYTGNYAAGLLTLFANALCAFMIYNGHRLHDTYQMVFFGLAGAVVYQYNIFGAVRAVEEYNRRHDREFFGRVRLAITAPF